MTVELTSDSTPRTPLGVRLKSLYWRYPIIRRVWMNYGAYALVVFAWALLSTRISDRRLPSPAAVLRGLDTVWERGILPEYVVATMGHVAKAVTIGLAVALPLGLAIGLNRHVSRFFTPLLSFFQALSGVVWVPVFIVWFGFSERAVIAVVNYVVIFPIVLNTVVGVRTVPPVFTQAMRTMGANRLQIIRSAIVPGALPNIMTGIRLGLAYGWRAVIGAELIIGVPGLGFMIFSARTQGDTARILLGMVVIGTIWVVLDRSILRPLERATIERWGLVR